MKLARTVTAFAVLLALLFSLPVSAVAAGGAARFTGTLADGATYLVEVPAAWNHTLLLYSHGYYLGPVNPAQDAGDPVTHDWLLAHGFALAGSSYAGPGWAVESALRDQMQVLDLFPPLAGAAPRRTIAWGHSMGGLITAGLVQADPGRFSGALPLCGWVAGGPGVWNEYLDAGFAFKTLLAPESSIQLTNITSPWANFLAAENVLGQAQQDAAGRARIALVSALEQVPGWSDPTAAAPAPGDYAAQERNQYYWNAHFSLLITFFARADLEARAGGNPSWNTGVDYTNELAQSGYVTEVAALYRDAGLDLRADLQKLESAPRIAAEPGAAPYLASNVALDGNLGGVPVLTVHNVGDGLATPAMEAAYRQAVEAGGSMPDLRQLFVDRAGHCALTPAETIAALGALLKRSETGHWTDLDPATLSASAVAMGPAYNQLVPFQFAPFAPALSISPAFTRFRSAAFLRGPAPEAE